MTSRWADTEADARLEAQHKAEKEEKKRHKAEKRRKQEEAEQRQREQSSVSEKAQNDLDAEGRPAKRRKVSTEPEKLPPAKLLRFPNRQWGPCRHVDNFERLNHIEEGSYGWVSRAKETATGEIVALKKLKMEVTNDGFPVTGLREIQTLLESRHPNIVELREVVMGETLDDVFLVMPFLEHDLKTILEDQPEPFLPSEIKTLLHQLTSAISYLHKNYILHRDLKTSNLLLSNRGELKIADFGMARYTSSPPPPNLTQLVVTLWYRSPDLLLGATSYGTDVDMWSLGCIFGELLSREPLLQGKNEVDQLAKIFALCGIPTAANWPGYKRLKNAKSLRLPPTSSHNLPAILHSRFPALTASGTALLSSLLALNPAARPEADEVLKHPYFTEDPKPKASAMFPTFPSKGGQERRRRRASPNAPKRGDAPGLAGDVDFGGIFGKRDEERGAGFSLRMG